MASPQYCCPAADVRQRAVGERSDGAVASIRLGREARPAGATSAWQANRRPTKLVDGKIDRIGRWHVRPKPSQGGQQQVSAQPHVEAAVRPRRIELPPLPMSLVSQSRRNAIVRTRSSWP
ncbi:hypothetical protein PI125_g10646 [Phytophthora idaei]|nr:hypothetical protein PI125_g10646 [Phytophthora idaei]